MTKSNLWTKKTEEAMDSAIVFTLKLKVGKPQARRSSLEAVAEQAVSSICSTIFWLNFCCSHVPCFIFALSSAEWRTSSSNRVYVIVIPTTLDSHPCCASAQQLQPADITVSCFFCFSSLLIFVCFAKYDIANPPPCGLKSSCLNYIYPTRFNQFYCSRF